MMSTAARTRTPKMIFSLLSSSSHPQSDILLCALLTVITFGLMVVSMLGMYYMAAAASPDIDETQAEAAKYWTQTSIAVFLGIVVSVAGTCRHDGTRECTQTTF
jgi:hypothetical protein